MRRGFARLRSSPWRSAFCTLTAIPGTSSASARSCGASCPESRDALERRHSRAAGVRTQRRDRRQRVRAAADGRYVDDLRSRLDAASASPPRCDHAVVGRRDVRAGRGRSARLRARVGSGGGRRRCALALAERLGVQNAIAFDMGGTTAKASLIENGRDFAQPRVRGRRGASAGSRLLRGSGELIRIPTIDIAEVGAGRRQRRLARQRAVRSTSGRAAPAPVPGPACYGQRGGRRPPSRTPTSYSATSRPGSSRAASSSVSSELARDGDRRGSARRSGSRRSRRRGAVHRLANASMMRALRAVSSEKGRDPREFALIAYGGAGPVHAAALADELGIRTVVVPPIAGSSRLRACCFARTEFHDVRFCDVDARAAGLPFSASSIARCASRWRAAIGDVGEFSGSARPTCATRDRAGTSRSTSPARRSTRNAVALLAERFEAEHERTYGVRHDPGAAVVIRALRLAVIGAAVDADGRAIDFAGRLVRAAARALQPWPPTRELVDVTVVARGSIAAETDVRATAGRRVRHDCGGAARLDGARGTSSGTLRRSSVKRLESIEQKPSPTRSRTRSSPTPWLRSPTRWQRPSSARRTRRLFAT